jgi:hypothetical protein
VLGLGALLCSFLRAAPASGASTVERCAERAPACVFPESTLAFELSPGVLWLFQPGGQSVMFTLTLNAGLW